MLTEDLQKSLHHLHVKQDRLVAAPIDVVFETVINPVGPMADMGIKIEAWPGGRWFRDLGNNAGHLWGHVQVIKPPKLLELCGPMMMSYPVMSHVQYRLTEEAGGTRLALTHQAVGLLTPEHREGVVKGWTDMLDRIRDNAQTRAKR
ncbi:MAG TPA: SRPBCC domain-containing protein [Humisphaera sp.]|jgi:uncharacterized protein YndB with AHSA1/START domain|nr:SRPBCC domain-containing protein [Humisphaera sp.]